MTPPSLPRNRLQEYFSGTRTELLSSFQKSRTINHHGERGAARESFVDHFLRKSFPQKFVVGSGEIIDPNGGVSPQADVVIYDETMPILHYGSTSQFLVEGVLAHVEIKSNLPREEVEDILTKGIAVKGLSYNLNPTMHLGNLRPNVSSFWVAYECPTSKETFKQTVSAFYGQDADPDTLLDGLFVLRDGFGFVKGDNGLEFFDAGEDVLALAFLRLMDAMWKNWSGYPNLGGYLSGLSIPLF